MNNGRAPSLPVEFERALTECANAAAALAAAVSALRAHSDALIRAIPTETPAQPLDQPLAQPLAQPPAQPLAEMDDDSVSTSSSTLSSALLRAPPSAPPSAPLHAPPSVPPGTLLHVADDAPVEFYDYRLAPMDVARRVRDKFRRHIQGCMALGYTRRNVLEAIVQAAPQLSLSSLVYFLCERTQTAQLGRLVLLERYLDNPAMGRMPPLRRRRHGMR